MKIAHVMMAAAAFALAGAGAHAAGRAEENQAKLARMLEGRTAGEPVTCVTTFRSDKLQVIEGVALVYDAGDTIYVARPTEPDALRRDDVVVIKRFGGQLCHSDIIRTVDRTGGYTTGVLFLEKWVPYKKPD
jgi:hypothetical protein